MENLTTNSQIHEYTLKWVLRIALLIILASPLQSQSLSTKNRKAQKLYEKADKKYKERDFYGALELLEQSVVEDPQFFEAQIRMGSLYNAVGQVDSVYSKFQAYVSSAPDPIASVLERMATMAFDRGHYDKSDSYLNQFIEKVPERSGSDDIILLKKSLEFAKKQLLNPPDLIEVKELPSNVNRFRLQYLPSITIDNASIFYTKRDNVKGDEDIVVSNRVAGEWTPAKTVSNKINSSFNEGACTVSADGRTMIFTSCDGRNSLGSCDLYISKKTGDNWSYPKNLGKPINTIYWESQPSLSADGKTLYFSSNRRGGYGGRDIWVSKSVNEKWSTPLNLGKGINTGKDETTPFVHSDGVSLYFSANGYPGMGGYDLFVSEKKDSVWSTPLNLGYPINTFRDEVSIVISSDGALAYFAKEEQKNFEILDSKIVSFVLSEELKAKPTSYIVGSVSDATSNHPIAAEIQVVSLESNKTLYSSKSDSLTGEYFMVLPPGTDLAGYIKKKGYLFADFHFTTKSNSATKPDTINIELSPIKAGQVLVLENIYFNSDSFELNEKSTSELRNAYQLLEENPLMSVEIAGHTDNTGSSTYNQQLSELRAKEVYYQLIELGISVERLSFKGYSDKEPIATNETEKGRKSNRRIEFRVLRTKR